MNTVKEELRIRNNEITEYLKLISELEEGTVYRIDADNNRDRATSTLVQTSIKASAVLMLYNIVESILTKSLTKLHEIIKRKSLKYENINEELQSMLLIYFHCATSKSENIHSSIDQIKGFISCIRSDSSFQLSYEELNKYYSLYSGNLDAKEIIAVLKKYGISFDERISELHTIKILRNKLAHGEESFEECGRNLTIQQLRQMEIRTFKFLSDMVLAIENFINEEGYSKRA